MSNFIEEGHSEAEWVVIESIDSIPEDPSKLRISFRGYPSTDVALRTWADLNLKVGLRISRDQLQQLENRIQIDYALEIALRFLRTRARTVHEVNAHLLKRGLSETVRQHVLASLLEQGLVNDREIARALIAKEASSRSRREIAFRLRQRGIRNTDVVTDDDADLASDVEFHAACKSAEKYWGAHQRVDVSLRTRRLAMYLQRRGYPNSIIRRVLNALTMKADVVEEDLRFDD